MDIGNQNGIVTYHHDQSITFVNFNTTNAIPNKVNPLVPSAVVLELLLIFTYLFGYFLICKTYNFLCE